MTADKRKASLYFPEEMLREIDSEAQRLDRSHSWVLQFVWRHGKDILKKIPSLSEVSG
jgi:uncharacterized small protein (TIGR04563 family)